MTDRLHRTSSQSEPWRCRSHRGKGLAACIRHSVSRVSRDTAVLEVYGKFRAERPDFKVLKYAPEIQDVQVADGWAIDWVYYEAMFQMSTKDNPVSMRRKGLRVLKRQSDGSWKFAREAETDEGSAPCHR
jgi:hypothetical protein